MISFTNNKANYTLYSGIMSRIRYLVDTIIYIVSKKWQEAYMFSLSVFCFILEKMKKREHALHLSIENKVDTFFLVINYE